MNGGPTTFPSGGCARLRALADAVQAFRNLPMLGRLTRLRGTTEYARLCVEWEAARDALGEAEGEAGTGEGLTSGDAVAGREAEELRAGLEALIAAPPGDWPAAAQALLDRVDARDSLAHVTARDSRWPEVGFRAVAGLEVVLLEGRREVLERVHDELVNALNDLPGSPPEGLLVPKGSSAVAMAGALVFGEAGDVGPTGVVLAHEVRRLRARLAISQADLAAAVERAEKAEADSAQALVKESWARAERDRAREARSPDLTRLRAAMEALEVDMEAGGARRSLLHDVLGAARAIVITPPADAKCWLVRRFAWWTGAGDVFVQDPHAVLPLTRGVADHAAEILSAQGHAVEVVLATDRGRS